MMFREGASAALAMPILAPRLVEPPICYHHLTSYHNSVWHPAPFLLLQHGLPISLPASEHTTGLEDPTNLGHSSPGQSIHPGHFETSLNRWDYFKLLFLQKQREMAEEAVLLEESCVTHTFCS